LAGRRGNAPPCRAPQRYADPANQGRGSPVRLSYGDGLYLLVQPSGSALWRFDYILQGRRSTLSFGSYPEVSLTLARQRRAEARAKVDAGSEPSRERQEAREAAAQVMTFAEVADGWLERQRHVLARVAFEIGDLDAQVAGQPVTREAPDRRDRTAGVVSRAAGSTRPPIAPSSAAARCSLRHSHRARAAGPLG
jgi:hypothetical protein